MTKEALERIKQAYYSGLKVQIWFNGHWENFDARDYSMYADPFSENRQYRIVGSAYTDIAEKRIEELEKENAELKEQIGDVIECFTSSSIGDDFEMAESAREVMEVLNMQCYRHGKVKSKLTEAKEIIKMLVHDCYSIAECEDTNLGLWEDDLAKAEQFLKENEE